MTPQRAARVNAPTHAGAAGFARQLARLFNRRERATVALLALLILFGALLEAAGAGLVFPFITAVESTGAIQDDEHLRIVWHALGQPTRERFILIAAVMLLAFYVVKNLYIGVLIHVQNRFVYQKSVRVADSLLRKYMSLPYEWHLGENTATLLRNVNTEVQNVFSNVLVPLFIVVTEATVAVALVVLLVAVAPAPALAVLVLMGGTGVAFYSVVRSRLRRLGREQQAHAREMIRWINQALGGIKEARVLGREDYFVARYRAHTQAFASASQYAMTINQLPKLFIETVAIASVLSIVVVVTSGGASTARLMPTLGLFAMASLRLIPSLNRIVASFTRVVYYRPAVDVVVRGLDHVGGAPPRRTIRPLEPLAKGIDLRGVRYAYPGCEDPALTVDAVSIPRGAAVAITGPSGAGKTTLVDVILGLLVPHAGSVLVDNRDIAENPTSWQRQIGYVPQQIYLSDDSIRRNIAFGVEEERISDARIWQVLEAVQLADFVQSLPAGLDTTVGERGVRLSGGQRQRIGLARALHDDPSVLVLDEATSALDKDTERGVTDAIEAFHGKKTVLVIAHRMETIQRCDHVIEVRDGRAELVQAPLVSAGQSDLQGGTSR